MRIIVVHLDVGKHSKIERVQPARIGMVSGWMAKLERRKPTFSLLPPKLVEMIVRNIKKTRISSS